MASMGDFDPLPNRVERLKVAMVLSAPKTGLETLLAALCSEFNQLDQA
jgi:hypothetical protein